MFHVKLLVTLTVEFISLYPASAMKRLITYDNTTRIYPINTTSENSLSFVISDNVEKVTPTVFGSFIKPNMALYCSFYYFNSEKAFVCQCKANVAVYKRSVATPQDITISPQMTITPTEGKKSLWGLYSKDASAASSNFIERIDLQGKVINSLTLAMPAEITWRVKRTFYWSGFCYFLAHLGYKSRSKNASIGVLLGRLVPNDDPKKDHVKFLLFRKSNYIASSFLPSEYDARLFIQHHRRNTVFSYSMVNLDHTLKGDIEEDICYSLEKVLASILNRNNWPKCTGETTIAMYIPNTLEPVIYNIHKTCKLFLQLATIYRLNSDWQTTITLLWESKNRTLIKCYIEPKEVCYRYVFRSETFNLIDVSLDTKSNYVSLIFDYIGQSEPARILGFQIPLIECNLMQTCATCEMMGYFYHCAWNPEQQKCLAGNIPRDLTLATQCFTISAAHYSHEDNTTTKIYVIASYKVNKDFDYVKLSVDKIPVKDVEYQDDMYVGTVKIAEPRNVILSFQRSMGAAIHASSNLTYGKISSGYSAFSAILYFFLLPILIISAVFAIIYYIRLPTLTPVNLEALYFANNPNRVRATISRALMNPSSRAIRD